MPIVLFPRAFRWPAAYRLPQALMLDDNATASSADGAARQRPEAENPAATACIGQARQQRHIDMGSKRIPDFEAWAIFAKVAQTGSFSRAAAELSISQATVSKAVTRLEDRIRTTLFHRTSRSMSLTASGEAVLARAAHILEEGEAVEAEVSAQATTLCGLVRVAAPMSYGIAHLAPVLPQFLNAHPGIELDLNFDDRLVDVVADRFDIALRIARLEDSTLLARRLCTVRLLLVGSPSYLARNGRPRHPHDLGAHRILHYSNSHGGTQWRFRHPGLGECMQSIEPRMQANNAEALNPALLAGAGLALQPEFLVWHLLRDGVLQTAMDGWEADAIALHLITPPGRMRPARVQALIDHLVAHFSHEPWADTGGASPGPDRDGPPPRPPTTDQVST